MNPLNFADFFSWTPTQQSTWILSIPEYVNQREGTVAKAIHNVLVKFERNTDGTIKVISQKKVNSHSL